MWARDVIWLLGFALGGSALGCRDPVAPMVIDCDDGYRPAMCLDGEEVCETDDRGCRMCSCEMPELD
jgi:hypothetical protein